MPAVTRSRIGTLDEPLVAVLGDKSAHSLTADFGMRTVGDLLRHYPRRYAKRGELTDLASLRLDELVTVVADVKSAVSRKMQNRRGSILDVVVTDGRGELRLTFFNQSFRAKELQVGRRGLFAGKVGSYRGKRQLVHPDYQILGGDEDLFDDVDAFAGALIPVYPATAKIPSWRLAGSIRIALDRIDDLDDPLPEQVRAHRGLVDLATAFRLIHRPDSHADVSRSRHRFAYEEAYVLQAVLAQRRAAARARPATPRRARPGGLLDAFDERLPFTLTDGQRDVGAVLAAELAEVVPMQRLLQGEVGAGKTVVALRAMLAVVDAGGQAALLAPTEVLAQQHHRSLTALLGPLAEAGRLGGADNATRVALLTGSLGAGARREALLDAASGAAGIVVGTHALLEDPVQFADLGLVVVDEQHRFGVEQRDVLRSKAGTPPHLLVMTATPIPRTVAMTVFGDLEVSTLTELPRGRSPIATHVIAVNEKPAYLDRAWQRVREEVAAGHRAFVVCPRIGIDDSEDDAGADVVDEPESDEADTTPARRPPLAVLDVAPSLADGPLHGLRVEQMHGRLPADVKDLTMRRFAAGDLEVLVATTVVEVGVDVSDATVMVILDADRFGVSQLHQLRGRVGRGAAPGLCLLVTDLPVGTPARDRLDAVASTDDGFELSKVDLEQRREGDVLGASQSGRRSSLRVLSVLRDEDIIADARDDAAALIASDPELTEHPVLAKELAAALAPERADYLEKS